MVVTVARMTLKSKWRCSYISSPRRYHILWLLAASWEIGKNLGKYILVVLFSQLFSKEIGIYPKDHCEIRYEIMRLLWHLRTFQLGSRKNAASPLATFVEIWVWPECGDVKFGILIFKCINCESWWWKHLLSTLNFKKITCLVILCLVWKDSGWVIKTVIGFMEAFHVWKLWIYFISGL